MCGPAVDDAPTHFGPVAPAAVISVDGVQTAACKHKKKHIISTASPRGWRANSPLAGEREGIRQRGAELSLCFYVKSKNCSEAGWSVNRKYILHLYIHTKSLLV